jgi:hypothetical protein
VATQAVGQVSKGEGDRVGATAKHCAKPVEDDEGDVEADEEEEEEENGGPMMWPKKHVFISCCCQGL